MSVWSQGDVDSLKQAVSTGVLSVTYSGPPSRTVTYQSLEAMRALLAEMIASVGDAAGTRRTYRAATIKKGV